VPEGHMKELIEYIAKALVDHPEDVRVDEITGGRSIVYELHVARSDMGRVIGKRGRVANATRSLLRVAAVRSGRRAMLEIVD